MPSYHVAQYNIARQKAPLDDPLMKEFVDRLDELNALAEQAPGFVWRLQDETGNSTEIRPHDDPMIIVNMSVWESVDALHAYAYRSAHGPVYVARPTWFEQMDGHTLGLWWIPAGHEPDALEGKKRLELLNRDGPSAQAFTIKQRFDPPGG
jgi:hypothetical protein